MQLAILHYHLNSGGVAKVVQNHLLALAESDRDSLQRVWLLHGGRAKGWPQAELSEKLPFPCECVTVEGLDYDGAASTASLALADSIAGELNSIGCTPDDTLLHWHNHSLGKNVSAPLAVAHLATAGYCTLLQIHDFAEDFRPDNYRRLTQALADGDAARLPEILYPQAEQIHYAALNRRDHEILSEAGVAGQRLHLLPNPVAAPPVAEDETAARRSLVDNLGLPTGQRLLTYPVRGIRRKNLGELLLWSALTERTWFFVTLAPQNPVELAPFEWWRTFALEQHLPCRLGSPSTHPVSYGEVLAASDALVTTSIAEGFGMVFLETWLAGKELLGRDLPEITCDFTAAGLDLSQLYTELAIPTSWIDRRKFVDQVGALVQETYRSFGVASVEPGELEKQLTGFLEKPSIDFARLPFKVQIDVILRVAGSKRDREQVLTWNPRLQPELKGGETRIAEGAAIVGQHYSLANLGQQLAAVYTEVWQSPPQTDPVAPARGQAVFDSLLRLDRLHPIRVES